MTANIVLVLVFDSGARTFRAGFFQSGFSRFFGFERQCAEPKRGARAPRGRGYGDRGRNCQGSKAFAVLAGGMTFLGPPSLAFDAQPGNREKRPLSSSALPRRSRHGRTIRHLSRSRIRDECSIDYVSRPCYMRNIPLIEGRFREAILKAERDVASTAAGNRGHESPAPQPVLSGWWRGAFAPDPATGTEAGPGPTTPRRSAVRRASRLRGRCHCLASVASRVTA
jgi:hypothetical protein